MTTPMPQMPDLSAYFPKSWILELPDAEEYRRFNVKVGPQGSMNSTIKIPAGVSQLRLVWSGSAMIHVFHDGQSLGVYRPELMKGAIIELLAKDSSTELWFQARSPQEPDIGHPLGVTLQTIEPAK